MERRFAVLIVGVLVAWSTTPTWATTPPWVETFAGMTGGPYNSGPFLNPTVEITGLTTGLTDMTLSWVCGSENTAAQFAKDTAFSLGTPSGGNPPTVETASRLAITQATDYDMGLLGPLSQGHTQYWKYDVYVAYPSTTESIGNTLIGVTIGNGSGDRQGNTQGMLFHLQLGRNDEAEAHEWRVRQIATVDEDVDLPGYAISDFKSGKWVKITFEHDPDTLTLNGYFDDTLDFSYTYSAGAMDAYDATQSCIGFRSWPVAEADLYIDDITYDNGYVAPTPTPSPTPTVINGATGWLRY
jgi:hypothetical protein